MGHLEMMGTVWGRWTVIGPSKKRASDGRFYWHCRCECGTERDVCGGSLRHGKTLSCGCLTAEVVGPRAKIHFTTHGPPRTGPGTRCVVVATNRNSEIFHITAVAELRFVTGG